MAAVAGSLTHGSLVLQSPPVVFCPGTVIYVAPEVLKQKYSFPADIWSCGIIACLLLAGRLPFSGEEGQEVTDLYMSKQHFVNKVTHIVQCLSGTCPCIL